MLFEIATLRHKCLVFANAKCTQRNDKDIVAMTLCVVI